MKTKIEEKENNSHNSLFEDNWFSESSFTNQQISVIQNEAILENVSGFQNEAFLDNFLIGIKLIFLYAPGAMAIHLVGMFAKMYILYGESIPDFFPELSGFVLIGAFLTMLGIGKLSDLRYLKVPAAILAISVLLSITHALINIFSGRDTEGIFWLISMPIVVIWGYLVKRFLDTK